MLFGRIVFGTVDDTERLTLLVVVFVEEIRASFTFILVVDLFSTAGSVESGALFTAFVITEGALFAFVGHVGVFFTMKLSAGLSFAFGLRSGVGEVIIFAESTFVFV